MFRGVKRDFGCLECVVVCVPLTEEEAIIDVLLVARQWHVIERVSG